jgi:hypothetical protein
MKHLIAILLILFSAHSFGQILKNTSLNLNAGGVIHDVVYDSYYDAYIVVGDFTSINGQPRNNLAFIDANTMNVMSYNPITSIDGEIRTVEFYSNIPLYTTFPPDPINPDGRRYYLYLGGNFGTINGDSVEYLARLSASHIYGSQPAGTKAPYVVNSTFRIDGIYVGYVANFGVYDLHLDADTLVVAGEFYSQKGYYPYAQRNYLNAYDVTTNSNNGWMNWFPGNTADVYNSYPIYSIEKFEGEYYFTSQDDVYRYTPQGTNTTQFNDYFQTNGSPVPQARHVGFAVSSTGDIAKLTTYDPHSNNYYVEMDSTNQVNTGFPYASYWQAVDFETYKDYIYSSQSASASSNLTTRKLNSGYALSTESTVALNSNWQQLSISTFTPERQAESLFRQNNRLFLSGSSLTTVDGTSKVGLAVFCLEPRNADPFTSFDNLVCEGDMSPYTVPQAEYAEGYRWTYTGTGALYRTIGSSTWNPLSTEILSGADKNTIEIQFPVGATSGVLSVEPYSVCNTSTDYQFSEGQSGSITVNVNPNLITQPTATLNCYSDTAQIVAQSTNPNAQFIWSYNGVLDTTDIVLIYEDSLNSIYQGIYSVVVTDTLTGCFNSGITDFWVDTVATQISQTAPFTSPLDWTCLTDSMTINGNQSAYSITWEDQANLGVFHPDPYTIDSVPLGLLTIHGIEISNGCPTSADYGINVNQEYATGVVQGYATLDSLIDDSINCFLPTLNLACEPSPMYSSIASSYWVESGTQNLNLNPSDSIGMDAANTKTYLFETTHNTSGCVNSQQFTVQFNVDEPFVFLMADQTINCSQSSVELNHLLSGSTITEGWLDSLGTQTGNQITQADSIGEYYYQVQGTNGCFNTDTVLVTQSQELWVDMPSDTLVCRGQSVSIAPQAINNTEPLTYSWSTGSSAPSETAIGGVDSLLYVTVTTPSGCLGTDSTTISVTDTVAAVIDPIAGCTDGNLQVTSITGGLAPYQYSIDGTTYQTANIFSGLTFGNYTIIVQDDLGCEYSFDQSLTGSALSIDMNFLGSTYNEQGDTIVISNTTVFNGLDSVKWEYPTTADVQFESDSLLQLSMDIEGWYDITLFGYLDSVCEYSITKPVYFGGLAPQYEIDSIEFGITNFTVSPNPTSSSFTIVAEFGKAQNYSIVVTTLLGQPVPTMSVSGQGQSINLPMSFPSGTASSTYYVYLIGDYDAKRIAILLN